MLLMLFYDRILNKSISHHLHSSSVFVRPMKEFSGRIFPDFLNKISLFRKFWNCVSDARLHDSVWYSQKTGDASSTWLHNSLVLLLYSPQGQLLQCPCTWGINSKVQKRGEASKSKKGSNWEDAVQGEKLTFQQPRSISVQCTIQRTMPPQVFPYKVIVLKTGSKVQNSQYSKTHKPN